HTRFSRDWSADVCSSDLGRRPGVSTRSDACKRQVLGRGRTYGAGEKHGRLRLRRQPKTARAGTAREGEAERDTRRVSEAVCLQKIIAGRLNLIRRARQVDTCYLSAFHQADHMFFEK